MTLHHLAEFPGADSNTIAQYLNDMDPPCPYSPEDNALQCKIADWLLQRAVSLIYEDSGKCISQQFDCSVSYSAH